VPTEKRWMKGDCQVRGVWLRSATVANRAESNRLTGTCNMHATFSETREATAILKLFVTRSVKCRPRKINKPTINRQFLKYQRAQWESQLALPQLPKFLRL